MILVNRRRIAIIGAGQAGVQLAIHLLLLNYKVSLFSDRSTKEIESGSILSSQVMFAAALKKERLLGLNFWDEECPKNKMVTFSLASPNTSLPAIHWKGKVDCYQSIDQRIKIPALLKFFEENGGDLFISTINRQSIQPIIKDHAITLITTGKGDLSRLFRENTELSAFSKPQRSLACFYVKGMAPDLAASGVHVNIIPGVGEYFTTPGLTHNGHCEMMLFEGIPQGPFDDWGGISYPQQFVEKAKALLKKFVPWESERCAEIQLTDDKAILLGNYTPIVRHAVSTLPCGSSVLGLGDAVVLNDPIAGQGANHACHTAYFYAERIHRHGQKTFDVTWMNETAELAWNRYGKHSTQLSNLLLLPPPPHVIKALENAEKNQALADYLANGFNEPHTINWLSDPLKTQAIMHSFC